MSRGTVFFISGFLAVATFFAGLAGIAGRETRFSAQAKVLIAPVAGSSDLSVQAADTLSRGTVVATFAETFQDALVVEAAYRSGGISESDANGASVTTRVLAGTSIFNVIGSSDDPLKAERVADVVAHYQPMLGGYSKGFQPRVLSAASGTASRSGPSSTVLLLIAALASLAAFGLALVVLRRFSGSIRAPRRQSVPGANDAITPPPRQAAGVAPPN